MIKHIALFKFGKFETPQEKEIYYNRIIPIKDQNTSYMIR